MRRKNSRIQEFKNPRIQEFKNPRIQSLEFLGTAQTWNGLGAIEAATIPNASGGSSLWGIQRLNCCNKLERKRNTSILVNTSPKHILLPLLMIQEITIRLADITL